MRKHWWFVGVGIVAFVGGLVVLWTVVGDTAPCGSPRVLTATEQERCVGRVDAAFLTRWFGFFLAIGGLMLTVYGVGFWRGRRSWTTASGERSTDD